MDVTLSKIFTFESAHFLPRVPPEHRCRRLHGHSYRVEIAVTGAVDPEIGWYLDYGDLSGSVRPLIEQLDHRLLNAVPGLENPTSELLARWLWDRLASNLVGLARVTIFETCSTRCDYFGPR